MNKQEKIELARELNAKYYKARTQADNLRETWEAIKKQCGSVGIDPEIALIDPPVFNVIIKTSAIDKYIL